MGYLNSLKVIAAGLVLSVLGVAAEQRAAVVTFCCAAWLPYVVVIRQVPLLLQLLFYYFVAFLGLLETPVGGLIRVQSGH